MENIEEQILVDIVKEALIYSVNAESLIENRGNNQLSFMDESFNWDDSGRASKLLKRVPFERANECRENDWQTLIQGMGPRIVRQIVHKKNDRNVLLSKAIRIGDILYFNTHATSNEFHFDHPSDHVQGMLLIEALRQAAIATAHLHGLPLDMPIVMSDLNIDFTTFLETDQPIVIRTITNMRYKNKVSKRFWIVFEVLQGGASCTTGSWNVTAFTQIIWKRVRQKIRKKSQRRLPTQQPLKHIVKA